MDTHQGGKQLRALRGIAAALLMAGLCGTGIFSIRGAHADAPPQLRLVDGEAPPIANLTPAQQQKLSALESASHTQSSNLFSQLQQTRRKLSDLYHKYDLDAVAAAKLNQDLNRVQGQLLDLRLSDQQQLRKILTPDQFAQLQQSIQSRPHPHHDRPDSDHNNTYRDHGWKPL